MTDVNSYLINETVDALIPEMVRQIESAGANVNNPAHRMVLYGNMTYAVTNLYQRGAIPGSFSAKLRLVMGPPVKECLIRISARALDGEGHEIDLEAVA